MFPARFGMTKNEYRFHLSNVLAKPILLFLNSAGDNKNALIQISRGNIIEMQANIAILRRLLWLELYIMAGPILPDNDR